MMTPHPPDVAKVEAIANTQVRDCYQCGKCSAGCPMGDQMDALPGKLVRLVQYGDVNEAAKTAAVWQCVSCLTCTARCPKSVDIAGIMDALKQISVRRKIVHKDYKRVAAFQRAFLSIIKRHGRVNELELTALFKLYGFLADLSLPLAFKDAKFALPMLMKNKLHIKLGAPVKDKALVKRIFERCKLK